MARELVGENIEADTATIHPLGGLYIDSTGSGDACAGGVLGPFQGSESPVLRQAAEFLLTFALHLPDESIWPPLQSLEVPLGLLDEVTDRIGFKIGFKLAPTVADP